MKIIGLLFAALMSVATVSGCKGPDTDDTQQGGGNQGTTILRKVEVTTDKAIYAPGQTVNFSLDKSVKSAIVRYYHLSEVIKEEKISSKEWSWTPPTEDFKGYMVVLYGKDSEGKERRIGSTAVDVSSTWTRFPRYGFLANFGSRSTDASWEIVENLKRYHINGLQFYDWHYDHHKPLAGTPEAPESEWPDIIGRIVQKQTVEDYIAAAHNYGMAAMWYDLCYGALEWAEEDGASWEWGLYKDRKHSDIDYHPLDSFRSHIYLMDPNNDEWLDYFSEQAKDVYEVFDFDGFHIDQLGGRGTRYDYDGNKVDVPAGYGKFIERMKREMPDKLLAFNAVSRYGQNYIAAAPTDFLYNEVWDTPFTELKRVIDENNSYAEGRKNTILAAYMNYRMEPKKGYFNDAAVLLTDAVIFALGGAHLELGEHMLCSEYFPNTDIVMSSTLKDDLVWYYDFLVGYENLLRDGVDYANISVTSRTGDVSLCEWAPQKGSVLYIAKKNADCDIIHLLNFRDATHLNWRDDEGNQAEPKELTNISLRVKSTRQVTKAWVASPDVDGGAPQAVEVGSAVAGYVNVTIPSLKYWTMLVLE